MHRRSRWLLCTAAAGLVTGLLPAGASAGTVSSVGTADVLAVTTTATFNDPSGDAIAQNRIRDHIAGLINATLAGSSITVGLYTFTDDTVGRALVDARNRGVAVKAIVDHDTVGLEGSEYETLRSGLGTDRSQPSWVLACPAGRGCIGTRDLPSIDGPINHNKFFLFSSVGGASKVVVQTSANMTTKQRVDLFNNAVTIVDAGLYDIYQAYFADLLAYGTSGTGLSHYYRTPTSATNPGYKAYHFPRKEATGTEYHNDAATDTIKLILDNVSCAGGTQVRMAASLFSRDEVAAKLVALKNAGCSVTLAHDGYPGSMSANVADTISGKLTKRVQCYESRDTGNKVGLHSKYLLIDGTYDGVAGKKLVWTGSHNFTYPALRANDETLLKIDNPALYAQFKANHDHLMSYCQGT